MTTKKRLSASVDAPLLDAAKEAVARGRAPNLSAWVSEALRLKHEHDRRLEALGEFVARFEAEHGELSSEELQAARRRARARAVTVRPLEPGTLPGTAPGGGCT
jgi:Arc/MetJ-type ribon-helix-helix transcriptional regulator